jgi:cytochrome c oxidase assembly factor CtaG
MAAHIKTEPIVATLLFVGWAIFWFWAFSFAYSDGFFLYNRHSRIPIFVAALVAAMLIPLSAVFQWRQYDKAGCSGLRSLLSHSATCLIILTAPVAVFWALSRAQSPWRLEADDAMGAGIDFMLLLGITTLSIVALAVTIAVQWHRRSQKPGSDHSFS